MPDDDFPSRFELESRHHEGLEAEVVRLKAELAWYRGRAHRAEYIVVGLASTLSRYSGFDEGALIQSHAPENAGSPETTSGG